MSGRQSVGVALPALAVVVGGFGLVVAFGVGPGDALHYLTYELGFIVVPGWLLYRALSSRPGSPLRQLALGWALGYVLEIAAFMLTAASDTRGLFVVYPLAVGIPALVVVIRRRTAVEDTDNDRRLTRRGSWLAAALCLIASAYVALAYFPITPIPGEGAVRYFQDYPWTLSIAAEAKNHWPIQDPNVSGEPFSYHYFVHVHLAAASQALGVDLPLIFFRLFVIPLVVLVALLVVVAGKSLARSAYAGLIAAALVFLVGQVNLAHGVFFSILPFNGVLFTHLIGSPSFLLGLVMFLSLMIVLGEVVAARVPVRCGQWALFALFLLGASDAKIVLLPLIFAALILYAGWLWLQERKFSVSVGLAAALTVLVGMLLYLLQYSDSSSGLNVDLAAGYRFFTESMPAVSVVKDYSNGVVPTLPGTDVAVSIGSILFGAFGLFAAQLLGVAWLLARQGHRLRREQAWLVSLLCAGVLAVLLLESPGSGNVLYFLPYSLVAGCVLAGEGLLTAWRERPTVSGQQGRVAALAAFGLLLLVAVMVIPEQFLVPDEPASVARTYIFSYGGLIAGLILLSWAARRWIRPPGWVVAAVVSGVILAAGALDTPIEQLEPIRDVPSQPETGRQLTPELFGALSWIRDNTPEEAVVAVNNGEAFEFNHAAFSERRVFLGGWAYSARTRELRWTGSGRAPIVGLGGAAGSELYPRRLILNRAVFEDADPSAVRVLEREYGVRYLIVDEINGYPADTGGLLQFAHPVYRAPGVTVLQVRGSSVAG